MYLHFGSYVPAIVKAWSEHALILLSHAFGVLGSSPIAIEAVKFQTVEPREIAPLHAYVHVRPQYVNSNKWHQCSAEFRVFSMLSYS